MKFKLVIDRTKEEEVVITAHEETHLTRQIEALVQENCSDRIVAYGEDEITLLSVAEIECITVLDGKTWAIDEKGERFRLKPRLCELEKLLPAYFIRINKSSLANEKRLKKFSPAFSGAVDAVFLCGYREYVSRRCFAEIKRRYE